MDTILISAPSDGGNITVLEANDPANISLAITEDGAAKFHQWFYFRVSCPAGTDLVLNIKNAGTSSYIEGWTDYCARVSYDLEDWFCTESSFEDGTLTIKHTAQQNTVYVAYFAPYPIERYRAYMAEIAQSPLVEPDVLGKTIDGEPLDHLVFGTPAMGKPNLWIIGRQHPGETMGSWWMEGFLDRLTDPGDAVAAALREKAVLNVVPLVNIDGARRGHLRTNRAGTDLNRAWAEPSPQSSPEVFNIRNKMDERGCDFFLDVHGDEAIANNFIAGAEGVPKWNETHQQRLDEFKTSLAAFSPAFQTKEGYPVDPPGTADMRIATNAIAERFDCLAMTLEMPFKDAAILPDPEVGWSPARCRDLGRACLDAIWAALPNLR